jgi:Subtilase family/Bacterial pre-peptidase C-terminal domain
MFKQLAPAVLAMAFAAGCKNSESPGSTSSGPTRLVIVSGSNQTGNVSSALSAPLVVQVLNGSNQGVSGVSITWTLTGGGSVSPSTSTTDSQGQASVTWTLGSTPGAQTATATSSALTGAAVSFVAGTGAAITGAVTIANPDPTSFLSAARATAQPRAAGSRALAAPRYSNAGVEVMFHNQSFHVAAAGAPAYRSMDVAVATATALQQRLGVLTRGLPVRDARVSPAILAAHLTLTDSTKIESVIAALQADPSVASVTRDVIVTIHDGAPAPQAARFTTAPTRSAGTARPTGAATALPNDPYYAYQSWNLNMVDMPRAWALTTGSTAFSVAVIDMGVRLDDPRVAPAFTSDGYDFVSQTTLASLGYDSVGTFCTGGATFTTIDGNGPPHADPTDPDDIYLDNTGTCWEHNSLGDHGQWTSGIIGAVGNDGQAVTGVEWNARIRPIRVLGITGDGIAFDVAQGILYAAGLPAVGANGSLVSVSTKSPILSMSFGGQGSDPADSAAVAAAIQAGCLLVAAAGNSTTDVPFYPAAYPGVIGVSAVGMDGVIASYSNGGAYVSLAAPGGEFRLDDDGGDGVLGTGWDFTQGQATLLFGYGTSASAPHVAGAAALLLAAQPGMSATALAQRLEQYATRPPNSGRNDNYGWGIVDAYNAITQQNGPPRNTYVRLINSATGSVVRTVEAASGGQFTFAQLAPGSYQLQAGEDESGDATIGIPGRRLAWAGSAGSPTVFTVASGASTIQTTAIAIGVPVESEPNDGTATANLLSVNSYVTGQIYSPDVADYYQVIIPAQGTYTFQTYGVTGACGWGIELDTKLQLFNASGGSLASNDDSGAFTGPNCSEISASLAAGTYYVAVTGSTANGLANQGRYRLQVRSGS